MESSADYDSEFDKERKGEKKDKKRRRGEKEDKKKRRGEKEDKKRKRDITAETKDTTRIEDEIDTWKRRCSDLMERFKILDKVDAKNLRLQKILDHQRHRNSIVYASFKEKEEECRELEDKLSDLYERCYDAEQDFNEYTFMFDELCKKIEDFKKKIGQLEYLACSKHSAKINEYKKICSEMEDKIRQLEEDKRVVIERGTAEQERITYLEDQAMYRLKYELELEKRLNGYRTKYKELCIKYQEKKERVTSLENEVKENKGMCVQLNERIVSLQEDQKVMCEGEKRAQVRISYLEKLLGKTMKGDERELKLQHMGLDEENSTLRCSVGSRDYGERECAQRGSHNDKGENDIHERFRCEMNGGTDEAHVAPSTFNEKMVNNAENILTSAFQDSNNSSSQGNKDAHVSGIVEICDNKDENISPQRICHSGGREELQVLTGNRTEKCLKKPFSDQKGEVHDSSCEEDDTSLSLAAKRRYLKIVISDGEEDDTTLLGELQEKVLGCAWNSSNVALSSGGQKVEEFVSPSSQGQVSPRKCEEKKSQDDKTSKKVEDIFAPKNLELSVSSAQVKIGNLTSENDEEKVAQEAGSESEGDSVGGHFANGVDNEDSSSDSEDGVDSELDFGQVVAMMRSKTNKEMKWKNEADMLSSFEKDPVLCMKAVCALHRQQTDDERSIKGPFSQFSAL
ncbi:hypothetical protein MKW94_002938, partial [Papaver nudicaule]|nr:hypothetical protein [Papaver nudicaule]